jgi:hypothetical protein
MGEHFQTTFDPQTGELVSWTWDDVEMLVSPPRPNFWRAPTDNDFGNGQQLRSAVWKEAGRERVLRSFEVSESAEARTVEVEVVQDLPTAESRVRTLYTIHGGGEVEIGVDLEPGARHLPEIPRFGVTLGIPPDFEAMEWYGRGPHETYWDRKSGAAIARHRGTVTEQHHPYPRPQENGNKTDVRWAAWSDADGKGLLAVGLPVLSLSAHRFTQDDFDAGPAKRQRHTIDLEPRDSITLHLDFKQMGVGGDNSWGAVPHRQYTLWPQPLSYRFVMRPFDAGVGDLAELSRKVLVTESMANAAATRTLRSEDFGERNRIEHLARGSEVAVQPEMTSRYSAAGNAGLVDGYRGSIDRRGGDWQGYATDDFEAIIDLGKMVPIDRLETGFLQRASAQVFLPKEVEYALSPDGAEFTAVGVVSHDVPAEEVGSRREYFSIDVEGSSARFVRVRAASLGSCPSGHPQEGDPAWLFVDEVIVEGPRVK